MTSRQIKATANIAITKNTEEVVLIDRNDQPLGTSPKSTIHTSATPLHRGFSVFIFNSLGQVLLQKRALSKITWPGIWSNSCCGHPALGESSTQAASRRLKYELGLELLASEIVVVLPKYRYRAELYGIVENEICPVMVAETKWLDWRDFMNVLSKPNDFSAWCNEESRLLDENLEFQEFLKKIKT
jgi:isopentenyl-diphosphate delta-isomerase